MNREIETIYCGADDSNHAGDNRGEIIVVTFSTLREDGIVKHFPNRRDNEKTINWLENPCRDYRFTILPSEKYRNKGNNVLVLSPYIVCHYLQQKRLKPKKLNLYVDGWMNERWRRRIRDYIVHFNGVEQVVVDNFTKKGNKKHFQKRHCCPEVVYRADNIAHILLGSITRDIFSNEKLVPLDSLLTLPSI